MSRALPGFDAYLHEIDQIEDASDEQIIERFTKLVVRSSCLSEPSLTVCRLQERRPALPPTVLSLGARQKRKLLLMENEQLWQSKNKKRRKYLVGTLCRKNLTVVVWEGGRPHSLHQEVC